jgi:hypothetical protein
MWWILVAIVVTLVVGVWYIGSPDSDDDSPYGPDDTWGR